MLRYDFYSEGHASGNCVSKGQAEDANYVVNSQRVNPYFNTYNLGWKDPSNSKQSNNQDQNSNQGAPRNPLETKPSPLEETMT